MIKLRIKNCGPIKEGLTSKDGFLHINKCSFFIGEQGSGKSTIAKVFSICSWLEKAFFRGDYDSQKFGASDFKELYENQLLKNYFSSKTEIEYIGKAYRFVYQSDIFSAEQIPETFDSYTRPKIMYIPSERNILSVIKNVDDLEMLPPMLGLLRKRYLQAGAALGNSGVYKLPLRNYRIIINSTNGETLVQEEGEGNTVPLISASSGLQSIVPASLVTEDLAADSTLPVIEKIRRLSRNIQNLIRADIKNESAQIEYDRFITSGIAQSISRSSYSVIKEAAKKYVNSFFINIVEEPEQNLFPESQIKNLEFLISATNRNLNNMLVVTTHSPYLLSYLTLATKAFELYSIGVSEEKINKIIPESAWVDGGVCTVYQLKDGEITLLPTYGRGLPSDNNMLNSMLGITNDMFDQLLDLEEEFGS